MSFFFCPTSSCHFDPFCWPRNPTKNRFIHTWSTRLKLKLEKKNCKKKAHTKSWTATLPQQTMLRHLSHLISYNFLLLPPPRPPTPPGVAATKFPYTLYPFGQKRKMKAVQLCVPCSSSHCCSIVAFSWQDEICVCVGVWVCGLMKKLSVFCFIFCCFRLLELLVLSLLCFVMLLRIYAAAIVASSPVSSCRTMASKLAALFLPSNR